MTNTISRRNFLKLGLLSITGLAFNPFPLPKDELDYPNGIVGRVTTSNQISIYAKPDWDSPITGYLNQKDALVNIYYEITPPTGPAYNPLWYRVWGGYIHSAYIQKVKVRFNQPLPGIAESGQLCEVTVPYTQIYRYNNNTGWEAYNRLYYQTTHWVTKVEEGPDKNAWYRINDSGVEYLVPAIHLRPVLDDEITPISPEVPQSDKRIEVSIRNQFLTAYERNQVVFTARISTGLNYQPSPDVLSWNTPRGEFNIENKTPSRHMGEGNLTGDPEAYELPGVPWTMYFEPLTGVAFHGAYWHNNFGARMSHGCVNMRPLDAKWLFRWCHPVFQVPVMNHEGWEVIGYGTQVIVE
jgi:lipoprotein-anchoring transpeptidase ErfK/SrfK